MIAVVTYENPVIVEAVLRLNAYGVIASPVKSFGLLTSMVVAVNQAENAEGAHNVARLEQRLAGQRKIAKAKAILMQSRNISEEDAYSLIRNRAMTKRVTTEEIADAVIKANEDIGVRGLGNEGRGMRGEGKNMGDTQGNSVRAERRSASCRVEASG